MPDNHSTRRSNGGKPPISEEQPPKPGPGYIWIPAEIIKAALSGEMSWEEFLRWGKEQLEKEGGTR